MFLFAIMIGITSDKPVSRENRHADLKSENVVEEKDDELQAQSPINTVSEANHIEYEDDREIALNLLFNYKTKEEQYENDKRGIIKPGVTLKEVFRRQKEGNLIQETNGWFVVKDNERCVIGWRGMRLTQFLNNPQWAIKNNNIFALNGTAKKYTPELGKVSFEKNEFSDEVKFYLEWETLMESDDWDEYANQTNLDKIAKKWNLDNEKADKMFIKGQSMRDSYAKEEVVSRGEILTNEQIETLTKEQGSISIIND